MRGGGGLNEVMRVRSDYTYRPRFPLVRNIGLGRQHDF